MDRRTELKNEYKNTPISLGVFQIKNKINGKIYVVSGRNLQGKINSHRFQLKMGSHKNRDLQKDWKEYGEENFSFDILDTIDGDSDTEANLRDQLQVLEELWLTQLQPYGDRGYNRK